MAKRKIPTCSTKHILLGGRKKFEDTEYTLNVWQGQNQQLILLPVKVAKF